MSTPSEVAGRYRIERRLGAGGMSTVFLATDSVLERPVAVKLLAEHLAEDEDFVARFRREALSAAKLQHPNVVQVFDSGEDPGSHRHYIVMEYVDGPSCADMLRDQKQLEVDEAVRIVRDACHGLDYAHRAGVVHRDVGGRPVPRQRARRLVVQPSPTRSDSRQFPGSLEVAPSIRRAPPVVGEPDSIRSRPAASLRRFAIALRPPRSRPHSPLREQCCRGAAACRAREAFAMLRGCTHR